MAAHSVFYSKLVSKKNSYFILFFVCVITVAANILASQSFPQIMYDVMGGSTSATAEYLKRIWGTQQFAYEIKNIKEHNEESILKEMNAEESEQNKMIEALKSTIKQYPYAPEPYYNLSLIYAQRGQHERSLEYLQSARQIDPSLQ
jgi:tetratricopeptide (TPR) repeat protein